MEEATFQITVQVAGYRFPLNIKRDEEILYRDAAKALKEKLDFYQHRHPGLPYETILILAAYHFAVTSEREKYQEDVDPIVEKLKLLDKALEQALKV
ncbi:cell division protein ZapA [Microbacter margulisiae]|uniref:Cell division protein ZapA n=1 Tax=Microbacter margulisiae TaxID=1350067 RepID=A0A7W5DS08_9PORP|nr:cell division protein ZapA [Microbacter margulisiae]MBB3188009.1 cell division protein ZapA [Microbacter margulisiae]